MQQSVISKCTTDCIALSPTSSPADLILIRYTYVRSVCNGCSLTSCSGHWTVWQTQQLATSQYSWFVIRVTVFQWTVCAPTWDACYQYCRPLSHGDEWRRSHAPSCAMMRGTFGKPCLLLRYTWSMKINESFLQLSQVSKCTHDVKKCITWLTYTCSPALRYFGL